MSTQQQADPGLMSARQIAETYNLSVRSAENLRDKIARAHGGPVQWLDPDGNPLTRNIYVRRAWVEAAMGVAS